MFFQGLGMVAYDGDGGGGTSEIFRPPYSGGPAPWIPDTTSIYDEPPGPLTWTEDTYQTDTGLIPFNPPGPPIFQPPTLTYRPPTSTTPKPTLMPRQTSIVLDPSRDVVDYYTPPGTITETFRPPTSGDGPTGVSTVPISLASPGTNAPAAANTGAAVSPLIWVALLGVGALFLLGGKK